MSIKLIAFAFVLFSICILSNASDLNSSFRQRRQADSNHRAHRTRSESFKEMEGIFSERALYQGGEVQRVPKTGEVSGSGGIASVSAPVTPFPIPDNLTKQVTSLAGFGILFQRMNYVSARTSTPGSMLFYHYYILLLKLY